ncbi:V8-like Glu-specific endopeptidase [Donghicola eburneus]|uniref:Trypsin n=2 Tax=Roseobacteraceae TaxID=2854170 RepID=A0A1M4MYF9_9RHOB|nr:trypsin [Donghicola eburneus]SFQ60237.1 V8-like Glu-specific endopeptidase [Donghicola eburneus]
MRFILAAIALCLGMSAASAEESELRRLDTGVDSRGWEGVGRLDIGGKGFCTGALVAPDLVLTAAHCLFDKETGQRVELDQIEFLAGWRNGRALAYRGIRRAVTHPSYRYDRSEGAERVRLDLALLELVQPIRNTQVTPFPTGPLPHRGAEVGVVSYAYDRAEAPSLQEICNVLSVQDGVIVLSCQVDFGSSGAPIFQITPYGAKIVSVVAAKAEVNGEPVALGSDLSLAYRELRAELEMDNVRNTMGAKGPRHVIVGQNSHTNGTGAKFIRP